MLAKPWCVFLPLGSMPARSLYPFVMDISTCSRKAERDALDEEVAHLEQQQMLLRRNFKAIVGHEVRGDTLASITVQQYTSR